MFFEYKGVRPVVHPNSYIHPQATVIGSVVIGENVYIGPQAVLRGDYGSIIVEDGANVQECCVLHSFPNVQVHLHKGAHIGHGAVIHGASVGENALIGMNAVLMDDVEIGAESIVGALAMVKTGEKIPPRSLVVGNPARVIKPVSDEMLDWKTRGTEVYQQLSRDAQSALLECTPLTQMSEQRDLPKIDFENWEKTKKQ